MKRLMLAIWSMVGITRGKAMQEITDLTPLYNKYRGQWVALKDDEVSVISHASGAKEAKQKAVDKGFESPILFKVPSQLVSYIG